MQPLIKRTNIDLFEQQNIDYWEFKPNPRFFGLKHEVNSMITHNTWMQDEPTFNVYINCNSFCPETHFVCHDFREAFNVLINHSIRPLFTINTQ